ncbi:MAG: hypothetical protein O3A00_07920 [Planctomycetota bacterium]|nr:hypothetical protein [Planctomycetota bacterium]
MQFRAILLASFVIVEFFNVACVNAQPKPGYMPSTTHIFPAGARRGTSLEVRFGTECVPAGTRVHWSGSHVSGSTQLLRPLADIGEPSPRREPTITPITYPREWAGEVRIAKNAALGTAFWSINGAQGGTASRPFVIGDLPEFIETESNSTVAAAERVQLPVTINGQISGERDADYFRFSANAGETIVCEVMAARLGSKLEPLVELLDGAGRRIAFERTHVGADPVLAVTAATDGEFLLRVANVSHYGDPAHVYRVTISTRPFLASVFPASGRSGSTADVELVLFGRPAPSNRLNRKLTLPLKAGVYRLNGTDFIGRDGSRFTGRQADVADAHQPTNHVTFTVFDAPHWVDDQPAQDVPIKLHLPGVASGRLESPDAQDWYAIAVTKGDHISLNCYSGGSSIPVLSLHDTMGKSLQQARSIESLDRTARIEWTAPVDGEWRVRVRDLRYPSVGGRDFTYELHAARNAPRFELTTGSDSLTVEQGKQASLRIDIARSGGFNAKIDFSVEGLPSGVTLKNAEAKAGVASHSLNFVAADDARVQLSELKIIGRAQLGDQTHERVVAAHHLGRDAEGVSVGNSVVQAVQLAVSHKPIFKLECSEAYLYAYRGSVFMYPMQIERLNGFDGPILMQQGDRQNRDMDGVQILNAVVAKGVTEFDVPIYLPESMHINVQSQSQLYSQGFAKFTDQHGDPQVMLLLSEKRNMLRTLPPVVKLRSVDEQVLIQGSRGTARLQLERTTNFPGPMTLSVVENSDGPQVRLLGNSIKAKQTELVVEFEIEDGASAQPFELKLRAVGVMAGTKIITETIVDVMWPRP